MLSGTCSKRLRSPSRDKPSNFLHCRFLHARVASLMQSLASAKLGVRSAPRKRLQSSARRKRLQTASKAGNIFLLPFFACTPGFVMAVRQAPRQRLQTATEFASGQARKTFSIAVLRMPASANLQCEYIEMNRSHMPNNHRNIQMPRPPFQPDGGMLLICNWITQSSP